MWSWSGHMGGWWWVAVPMMIVFWTLIVAAVVVLVRRGGDARTRGSAEDVLAERFARGELDETEYRQRRDVIRGR